MTLLFYHFFIVSFFRAPLVSLLNWYKRKRNQRWKRQVFLYVPLASREGQSEQ
jgi:hypothetical protein